LTCISWLTTYRFSDGVRVVIALRSLKGPRRFAVETQAKLGPDAQVAYWRQL